MFYGEGGDDDHGIHLIMVFTGTKNRNLSLPQKKKSPKLSQLCPLLNLSAHVKRTRRVVPQKIAHRGACILFT